MQNTPQNNRHIALNSSGGIALGAYMAGIFFELIKEARKENSCLTIDIITGASAGAMTGAIAAYYLLNRQSINQQDYDNKKNLFYQAWVEQADLKNIDSIRAIEDYFKELKNLFFSKNESLLSGKAIKEIGNIIADSSSLEVDRPLALIMTATNLQGLLLQDQNHLDVKAISSAETRRFLFHQNLKLQPEKLKKIWEKVIVSSRISGAFPVAFPPIEDASSAESYNFRYLSEDYFDSQTEKFDPNLPMYLEENGKPQLKFSYTDGGILDNLPILKAVELEAKIHSDNQNGDPDFCKFSQEFQNNLKGERPERLYVYISPNSMENLDSKKRLKKTEFKLWDLIRSGLSLPKAEQEAIQLKRLMTINNLAESKTDIIAKIKAIKNESNQQQLSEIEQQIEQALPYPKINLSQITPSILKDIEKLPKDSRDKIQPLYHKFRSLLSINDDNWRSDELLSSDFLNAFGGFLDKRYRERDFILGRICGLTWLHKEFPGIETDSSIKSSIDSISADLDSKHLKFENPKFTDLKLSHRIRIFRIIVRGVRILTVQSELTGLWKILIPLNRVFFPLLFLSVEVGLSFIMILAQLLENLTENLRS